MLWAVISGIDIIKIRVVITFNFIYFFIEPKVAALSILKKEDIWMTVFYRQIEDLSG
ncbi:hypothetical protein GCM10008015_18870 [Flavobacterium palustre]|uniref:Uncharacterized protein n=1 Tax=Flavobacterium palustre TaxID=1476463 RepID=A0ABQ1HI06_9FLAO|nr:hypothetical protein GCM10008015_18870 [Flavobacterium palustre]